MKDRIFVAVFLGLVIFTMVGLTFNVTYLIISNQMKKNDVNNEEQVEVMYELTFSGEFSEEGEFIKTVVSQMGYYGDLTEHSIEIEEVPEDINTEGIETWWELYTGSEIKYITFKDNQVVFEN